MMGESADVESQASLSEGHSELDQSSQDAAELDPEKLSADEVNQCAPDGDDSNRDSDIDSLAAEPDLDSSHLSDMLPVDTVTKFDTDTDCDTESEFPQAGPVHSTDSQVPLVDAVHDRSTQVNLSAPAEHVVRTRVGRVSRKVNRFIESMV